MSSLRSTIVQGFGETPMPTIENLGYQIGIDSYVKIVRLSDGTKRSVTAPRRSGPWKLYQPILLPGGKVRGMKSA